MHMTVEQFDPSHSSTEKSEIKQTTTLDIPAKMIEEQHQEAVNGNNESAIVTGAAAKVGFVSLGCRKSA